MQSNKHWLEPSVFGSPVETSTLLFFFDVGLLVRGSIPQLFRGSYFWSYVFLYVFPIFWVRFGAPKLPKTV